MGVASSPSDYTAIAPDYANGFGFYTDVTAVADMLQVPEFTDLTNPTEGQVGSINVLKAWLTIRQSVPIGQSFMKMNFTILNLADIQCIRITEATLVLFN